MSDVTKFQELVRSLASFKGVAVAFSGGVDSSLLLYAAKEALRDGVVAFIGVSPMFPRWELEEARNVASAIGTELVEVDCDVLELEKVVANAPDRCYHCKRTILVASWGWLRKGVWGRWWMAPTPMMS